MSKQTDFFAKYADYAEQTQNLFGVPASITLAQAALESGWGTSGLTLKANNFFGIKASSDWKGETYSAVTVEYINGVRHENVNALWCKYSSAKESFNDHAKFLLKFNRYKKLFSLPVSDYKGWAVGLQSAGYATDPLYSAKLINMIQQYELMKYDAAASQKKNN